MENNKAVLKVLSVASFLISAIFTVLMWQSGAVGILAKVLTTVMAIILESAKLLLTTTAIKRKDIPRFIRGVIGSAAVLLFIVSITASLIFLSNQGNEVKNMSQASSNSYKANQEQIKIQTELYNSKKAEIDTKKAEIEKLPADWITKRGEKTADLSKLQTELESLGNDLKALHDPSNIKASEEKTKGTIAFFERICSMLNSMPEYEKNPVNSSDIEFWFFAGLAILFDTVAVLLYYLSSFETTSIKKAGDMDKKPWWMPWDTWMERKELSFLWNERKKIMTGKSVADLDQEPGQISNENDLRRLLHEQYKKYGPAEIDCKKPGPNSTIKRFKVSNKFRPGKHKIGFETPAEEKNFTDEEYQRYVKHMLETSTNGISKGYSSIASEIGTPVETCRSIRRHLERQGYIKTEGTKTIINNDKFAGLKL